MDYLHVQADNPWYNYYLVLVQPRKTRPYITEGLLMGRKESNETNKQKQSFVYNHIIGLSYHDFYACQFWFISETDWERCNLH